MTGEDKPQLDKFKRTARELECDEDKALDERLKKVAKGKPEPEKPERNSGFGTGLPSWWQA